MTGKMLYDKRVIVLVLALVFTSLAIVVAAPAVSADDPAFSTYPPPPPGASYEGDASGDGLVNIIDAMFIAQYTVSLRTIEGDCLLAADATSDGTVNILDAMHIAQYTVDPNGTADVLFKPLWEWPADGDMKDPGIPSQNGG